MDLQFKLLNMKYFIVAFFMGSTLFPTQAQEKPKLVVGIVVDQMCYDYLIRFQDRFSKNGFNLLLNEGTNCSNTHYNYVPTFTGPGHASIYTGTTPANHGIVGNEWYQNGKTLNCVDDSLVQTVGSSTSIGKRSPKNLVANTITDQLKLTFPSAKVISMSIKDRSAILPGGHLSNGSYWFDSQEGKMITSSFYKQTLPAWVETFNAKNYPTTYLRQTWNTYYDSTTYQFPDKSPYEVIVAGKQTATFPYSLAEISKAKKGYESMLFTPFANTYLTDFAIQSIYNEMLGQDQQVDMLTISYSTPDIAGHLFGPYSREIEDIYIRLDLELARLIKALNEQVGKDKFVLFLTADHAVVPVPQYLVDQQLPGGYVYTQDKLVDLIDVVKANFGVDLILTEENNSIYIDEDVIRMMGIDQAKVEQFIANEIRQWEGVKAVFTQTELMQNFTGTNWYNMIQAGFYPKRSGEITFILEPGYLSKEKETENSHKGTSHGSAFNYDTQVPLIWYGSGIKKQRVYRTINITDITPTLAQIFQIQQPNTCTGEVIKEVFKKNHHWKK